MKIIISIIIFLSVIQLNGQEPFDAFNKLMDEYNEAFTSTDDPKEQEAINAKYNKLISEAEQKLEKELEAIIQLELDTLKRAEEEFVIPEEIDYTTVVSPIEGVHICYFEDSLEQIVDNKNIGNNHNPVIKILGLKKSGNEKEKVQRIIDELRKRGLRD